MSFFALGSDAFSLAHVYFLMYSSACLTLMSFVMITSAYDTVNAFKYISVNRGETYRIKLSVNTVGTGAENERVPSITTDENGALSFTVKGIVGDSSEVMVFTVVYADVFERVYSIVCRRYLLLGNNVSITV